MRKLTGILLLLAFVVFAFGMIYLIAKPRHGPPLTLPVNKTARGYTVTVKSAKRVSGNSVRAFVEINGPYNRKSQLVSGETRALVCGTFPQEEYDGGHLVTKSMAAPPGKERVEFECFFDVPVDADRFDISQEFNILRPVNTVNISFKDVPLTKLPITRTFNGASVTLVAVHRNQKCFDNHFALEVKINARQDFEYIYFTQKLSDNTGHVCEAKAAHYGTDRQVQYAPPAIDSPPTNAEKFVSYFNCDAADKMLEKRNKALFDEQVNKAIANPVADTTYFTFTNINPAATAISFELEGRYSPEPEDDVRIVFRNVPIDR